MQNLPEPLYRIRSQKAIQKLLKLQKKQKRTSTSSDLVIKNREEGISAEIKTAKALKLERVRGSGCGEFHKGDIISPKYRIQHKLVKQICISQELLQKCIRDAEFHQQLPAILIRFRNTYTCAILPTKRYSKKAPVVDLTRKGRTFTGSITYGTIFTTTLKQYANWKVIPLIIFKDLA